MNDIMKVYKMKIETKIKDKNSLKSLNSAANHVDVFFKVPF